MEQKNLLPTNASSEIPILSLLKQATNKNVSAKDRKTLGKILYWAIIIGGSVLFVKSIPFLLGLMKDMVMLGLYAFALLAMLIFAKPAVNILQKLAKVFNIRSKRWAARYFKIETLQGYLSEMREVLADIHNRIGKVVGKSEEFKAKAVEQNSSAEAKFSKVQREFQKYNELLAKASKAKAAGELVDARKYEREAQEALTESNIAKLEGQQAKNTAVVYLQSANQMNQVIEMLRDNQTKVRILSRLTESTVDIMIMKLQASRDIREATEQIARMANFPGAEDFMIAFNAATEEIANNIGAVKNNLHMLDQSGVGQIELNASPEELGAFVMNLQSANFQKLNIDEMADPSYKFKPGEGDQNLKFLD